MTISHQVEKANSMTASDTFNKQFETKYFSKPGITIKTSKAESRPIRVGIPRALLYYKFYKLWTTYFEEVGAKVIISAKTNKQIKTTAISRAPDEDCYSTKLFYGHVMSLQDKVDYLFIPRYQSEHKTNISCPKFIGLAESLRSMYPSLPPIIMPAYSTAKLGHGKWRILRIAFSIGRIFTRNPFKIIRALRRAIKAHKKWKEEKWLSVEKLEEWKLNKIFVNDAPKVDGNQPALKIALVGHSYMLNDPYASLSIKKQLIEAGANVITSEQMPRELIEKQMDTLDFNMYFDYERELLGTVMHFLDDKSIDGIIHIIIFSCGPDSIVGEMVARFSKRKPEIPVLQLTFDELTGETGLKTRLEAFMDMVNRKKIVEEMKH
jgi:predicted nucleotide-binding protein (sugar kinase/HSP70/actin superfamily)